MKERIEYERQPDIAFERECDDLRIEVSLNVNDGDSSGRNQTCQTVQQQVHIYTIRAAALVIDSLISNLKREIIVFF